MNEMGPATNSPEYINFILPWRNANVGTCGNYVSPMDFHTFD